MLSNDAIRSELQLVRSGTMQPYNVNFFVHQQPRRIRPPWPVGSNSSLPTTEFAVDPDRSRRLAVASSTPMLPDVVEEFRPPS
jgi:hypothetical protein